MAARAAVVVFVMFLAVAGCSSGSARTSSPAPPFALRMVKASTPKDAARLQALVSDRGQPWGMAATRVTWGQLTPKQLPSNLVPSDTLGRGLLVARATTDRFFAPTTADSVAAADLLFERGLYIHATTRNAFGQPEPDAAKWASHVARELARPQDGQQSTSVNGVPALFGFGPASRFGGGGTDTFVRWVSAGWSVTVELQGKNAADALAVARSLGR